MLLPSKRMREKNTEENMKRIVGCRNIMYWMIEKLEKAQKRFVRKGIPQEKWVSGSSLPSLYPEVCHMESDETVPQTEKGHPSGQILIFRAGTVSCIAQRLYVYLNTSIYQIAKSPKRKPFLFFVSMNFSLTFILSCFII